LQCATKYSIKNKMEKKEGKYPINARISVDYSKGKPKIKFGYPRNPKKDVINQNAGTGIFIIPLLIIFVLLPYLYIGLPVNIETTPLHNCSAEFGYNNSLDNITIICAEDSFNINYLSSTYDSKLDDLLFYETDALEMDRHSPMEDLPKVFQIIFMVLIAFSFIFLILFCFIIDKFLAKYYTKWKWYQKLQPRFQSKLGKRAYYAKFKPGDIKEGKIEIPLFRNVKLQYKTSKGMSNELLRLDIMEHDFMEKVLKGKKPDKKSKKQPWLWKTTFTFKDKPKDGILEVWFK